MDVTVTEPALFGSRLLAHICAPVFVLLTGISLEQAMAVGDGANDLPMLAIAGLGVAYRAKPLVRQNANQAISSVGLDGVLYLLGMHDKDLSRA
ncbi:hypothetical protein A7A42_12815 [Acinetobacter baumannii]|nr:hypothetical protein A7A42_12815 [Acinetobacter baumannii]